MALAHHARIPTDGLVLYYDTYNPKCYPGTGNTVYDLSLYKNHGTMENITYTNKAFQFNGTNSRIIIPNSPSLQVYQDLTIIAFCTPPDDFNTYTRQALIFKHYNNEFEFGPFESRGALYYYAGDGAWEEMTDMNIDLTPGIVHQYALLRDATLKQYEWYYDGAFKQGPYTYNKTVASSTYDVVIGARINSYYYKGTFYAVLIYNRKLTSDEIRHIYNSIGAKFI